MSKRYFKIDTGRYGGEVTVGTASADFVEYWRERESDEMVSHVLGIDWEDHGVDEDEESDVDRNSPDMTEDGNISWHELDDFEHVTGPYSDNHYLVYEIQLAPGVEYVNGELVRPDNMDYTTPLYEEISEYEQYEYNQYVYSREAYSYDPDDSEEEYVPVLMMHSAEKGGFGEVFIETDGDFNPEKLAIGVMETDLCEIVEAYWYDGQELVIDFDYASTNGKGMYGCVGYINEKWHDDVSQFRHDSDVVRESLDDLFGSDD